MTLGERLISGGMPPERVYSTIFQHAFPAHQRLIWRLRVTLGGDPFTAEHELIRDLERARTKGDVEMALRDYHWQTTGNRAWGMAPSRRRLRRFCVKILG